ncbi:hypothetical protein [Streptomyces sp. NPDC047841]|uniref:hypothetical protein n=1 Tax=Streptomyces sp. NPDC047841 TaxID=3154708 RepID=UPI00345547EF
MVPLFRTADINALPTAHPEIDWQQLRNVGKGQHSPLTALVQAEQQENQAAALSTNAPLVTATEPDRSTGRPKTRHKACGRPKHPARFPP